MRRFALILVALAIAASGCSEKVLEPADGELSSPTTVSAQRYLSDNAEAARVLREFVAVLDEAGPRIDDAGARRIAPDLERLASEFTLRAGRIEWLRLEDTRLEEQRVVLTSQLVPAVAGVQSAALAAEDGDAATLVEKIDSLRVQLPQLAEVGNTLSE